MNKRTISIVIPVRNGERFLRASILSAIEQSREADEIIVVDDASTDGSADIANASEFSGRIEYFFNEQPSGFVDAWNRCIAKATGDFVTILHHDDLLHSDYLKHITNALAQYPSVRHLYSACNYIDASGLILKEPPLPHSSEPVLYSGKDYAHNYLKGVMSNNHIHRCPGVTTSKSLLINECTYRKEAGHIADDDFFYRVGCYTDVVGISLPLASFRVHDESETAKADLSEKLAADYIFQSLQTKKDESIFSDADKKIVHNAAVKYINEFLFYRVLNNDREGISKALKKANEFEYIMPGFMKQNLPIWAKVMWYLAENGNLNSFHGYVACLDTIKKLRNIFMR